MSIELASHLPPVWGGIVDPRCGASLVGTRRRIRVIVVVVVVVVY